MRPHTNEDGREQNTQPSAGYRGQAQPRPERACSVTHESAKAKATLQADKGAKAQTARLKSAWGASAGYVPVFCARRISGVRSRQLQ